MTSQKQNFSSPRQQTAWVIATMLLATASAHAEGKLIPHALARYEQDSDLLLVPKSPLPLDASGEPRLKDSFEDYSGGIDGEYRWRDNRLYLTTDYSHFVYQHFTQLNHNEFAGTGGLDWTATHKVRGNIGTEYNRHLLAFTDINAFNSQYSFIETTQKTEVSAIYDMNSHWSANAGSSYSTARLPDAGPQSYDLNQTEGNVGIKFIGAARLTTGINIDRMTGHYKNSAQPGYAQTLIEYTVDYRPGARTTVSGSIGYSKRAQTGFDTPATTGSFSFNQQLTVKTSYYLQFRRTLTTYSSASGNQLNNDGIAGAGWQATPKILVSASYEYTKAKITGNFNSAVTQRDDKIQTANAKIKYAALSWLTITPYYRYQKRNSTLPLFNFDNTTYGIELEARFKQ